MIPPYFCFKEGFIMIPEITIDDKTLQEMTN